MVSKRSKPGAHSLFWPGPAHQCHRPGVGVRDALCIDDVAAAGVLDTLVRDLDRRTKRVKNVL
jgi:hypothetical protein